MRYFTIYLSFSSRSNFIPKTRTIYIKFSHKETEHTFISSNGYNDVLIKFILSRLTSFTTRLMSCHSNIFKYLFFKC